MVMGPARRVSPSVRSTILMVMAPASAAEDVAQFDGADLERHAVGDVGPDRGLEEGLVVAGVVPDLGDGEAAVHRVGGMGAEAWCRLEGVAEPGGELVVDGDVQSEGGVDE